MTVFSYSVGDITSVQYRTQLRNLPGDKHLHFDLCTGTPQRESVHAILLHNILMEFVHPASNGTVFPMLF